MRLSEKLMLGSTMVKASRGIFYCPVPAEGTYYGCALGMMSAAEYGHQEAMSYMFDAGLGARLRDIIIPVSEFPCYCLQERVCGDYINGSCSALSMIIHLFDCHVCNEQAAIETGERYEHWTLEQIADWLEKVEGKEVAADAPEPVRTDIMATA